MYQPLFATLRAWGICDRDQILQSTWATDGANMHHPNELLK